MGIHEAEGSSFEGKEQETNQKTGGASFEETKQEFIEGLDEAQKVLDEGVGVAKEIIDDFIIGVKKAVESVNAENKDGKITVSFDLSSIFGKNTGKEV